MSVDDEASVPPELREMAGRVAKGRRAQASVRTLLSWFHAQRRGNHVVHRIRAALRALDLSTQPDFQWEYIDATVRFVRSDSVAPPAAEASEPVAGPPPDRAFRVKLLPAANREPVWVKPDETVQRAVTLMLTHDFSQLPIMTTPRDLKGVVTWQSIATRLLFGHAADHVRACMAPSPEVVTSEVSLFDVIPKISRRGFVLVRDHARAVCGIVTTWDLSMEFGQLAEPFLLLSEIEHLVRGLLGARFDVEELATVCEDRGSEPAVKGVADLTIGEYVRLSSRCFGGRGGNREGSAPRSMRPPSRGAWMVIPPSVAGRFSASPRAERVPAHRDRRQDGAYRIGDVRTIDVGVSQVNDREQVPVRIEAQLRECEASVQLEQRQGRLLGDSRRDEAHDVRPVGARAQRDRAVHGLGEAYPPDPLDLLVPRGRIGEPHRLEGGYEAGARVAHRGRHAASGGARYDQPRSAAIASGRSSRPAPRPTVKVVAARAS